MAQIAILGAGMVGICTALALQERGHDCVVVDRRPPGSETSYGNAGIIQAEAVEPYALPVNPLLMLRMAFGWKNAVALHWPSLPRQFPALYSYWRSTAETPLGRVVPVWRQLVAEAVPRRDALIGASGAGGLIRRHGYWDVHATEAGLAAALREAERRRLHYGVDFEAADSDMLARAEPALRAKVPGAIHWTAPWTCMAPGQLVAAYADLFRTRGGRIVQGDAASLTQSGRSWRGERRSPEPCSSLERRWRVRPGPERGPAFPACCPWSARHRAMQGCGSISAMAIRASPSAR